MRKRDRSGLALAPTFLRLALALTFIWSGLGKLVDRFEVQGEQAAILANYGVIPNPHAPSRRDTPPEETPAQPENDAEPAPDPADDPAGEATDEPTTDPGGRAFQPATTVIHLASWQHTDQARILATAADFPDPIPVRGYAGLVLLLHGAIDPGLNDEDSSPRMALWPDIQPDIDYDPWPVYLARAAAVTELLAGLLVGIGLLTRLGAISIVGVMLSAIWLTTIGPAIQSGDTALGFLPNHATFDTTTWAQPMWQFALLCMAASLFFAGPGTLSLDRLLLGGPPKPPAPKPQGQGQGKK